MTFDTQCTFQITGWEESTYEEIEGSAKLSKAKVTQSYSGAIEGTSSIEYLMCYGVQGTATFVGLERVCGSVDGTAGTFVLQHTGSFSEGKARSAWSIVAGSGTDALAALRGNGSFVAGHGEPAQVSLSYSFEPSA